MSTAAAPPRKTESMVFQLPTPVTISMIAPKMMAKVETSTIEPGMNPKNISLMDRDCPATPWKANSPKLVASLVANCPSDVAPEYPSITFPPPSPNVSEVRTHTWSPDILEGYEKNRKARVINATLNTL